MSFPVAKLYFRLKIDGSIPSSEARSKEMKKEIDRMLDLGIIEDARVRNGKVFRVLSKRMFDVEEKRKWKNGVEKALESYDTKSDYAINSNDSKSGNVSYPTIPMRILDSNSVTIDGIPLLVENTNIPGVFSTEILESYLPRIRIKGKLVMIENKESFLFADMYFPDASAIIYYSGRTTKRWHHWLLSNTEKIIFAPDYDPVGIEEFLSHRNYLYQKIELYIPDNLNLLFLHGKKKLYSDQYHILTRISKQTHSDEVESVLGLIRTNKKGVEQEVVFKPILDN
jgi:phospholipid N-methyltransferase